MIFDKLEHIKRYPLGLEFILQDLLKDEFNKGRFGIDGDQKFGIDLSYETKEENLALWEAHRKYLDIHILVEGEEKISVSDITSMTSSKEYEDDYELFEGNAENTIHLKKGYFLVLFPNEVHKTSIQVTESVSVKKKVYKVLI